MDSHSLPPRHQPHVFARLAGQSGTRGGAEPQDARALVVHHRRFDLPGEHGPLLHAAVRHGLARSCRVQETLEDLAREIPDAFLREFGQWCAEHGVKGKYSVVPYPACVGWLDRELPGWSRQELADSLQLVRELMVPNWDIHPEMITHTRVIDLQTGRPLPEISDATMENSYPQTRKSVDELAAYLAYALRILKNCDLPCEGITTPGGFGGMVPDELSLAVQEAVRDVYGSEIPHYFKYVADGDESAEPRIEHVRDATGSRSASDGQHLWGHRRLVR